MSAFLNASSPLFLVQSGATWCNQKRIRGQIRQNRYVLQGIQGENGRYFTQKTR